MKVEVELKVVLFLASARCPPEGATRAQVARACDISSSAAAKVVKSLEPHSWLLKSAITKKNYSGYGYRIVLDSDVAAYVRELARRHRNFRYPGPNEVLAWDVEQGLLVYTRTPGSLLVLIEGKDILQ